MNTKIQDTFGDIAAIMHPPERKLLADMLLGMSDDIFICTQGDSAGEVQLFSSRCGTTRIDLYDKYGDGLASAALQRLLVDKVAGWEEREGGYGWIRPDAF